MSGDVMQRIAAKAIIVRDGKVLVLREASTYKDGANVGKYHLPGGRVEVGESFFDGLKREVSEETGLSVEPIKPVTVDEWRPIIQGQPNQIIGVFYHCDSSEGDVVLSEEHDEFRWIDPRNMEVVPLLEAEARALQKFVEQT